MPLDSDNSDLPEHASQLARKPALTDEQEEIELLQLQMLDVSSRPVLGVEAFKFERLQTWKQRSIKRGGRGNRNTVSRFKCWSRGLLQLQRN